uniref:Serine/arginine repetitive matrix 4 n=1 Tax=Sphaeramia orbicularis TaxID=375764 RepID=A0A672YQB9_9TELE
EAGQLEEKQLFEKFWKGTFKAVATPRPESVIVASITARRRFPLCFIFPRSPSFDEELSPRPKGKKKKRKSERKRKRKRSVLKRRWQDSACLVLSYSVFVCLQILSSKPVSELLQEKESHHLSSQTEAPHDYDSGNDTSSPPSSKTGVSRASVTEIKRNHCQRLATDRDNASDSGNSVTSYASLCKPYREESLSVVRSPKTSSCPQRLSRASRRRLKNRTSSSSRSRSRSSGSSRYSGRYSRSPTLSSSIGKVYRVLSNGALKQIHIYMHIYVVAIKVSHCYVCFLRLRDRKRTPSSRESDAKHEHKVSGKRRRRKSYSPMKKRRRDSPSHLEARRITRCYRPHRPSPQLETSLT